MKSLKEVKKKCILISAVCICLLLLFGLLYYTVPAVYIYVNYRCSIADYYRQNYEEKWNIMLPKARLVEREVMGAGYDGTETVYTVFKLREPLEPSSELYSQCNTEIDGEIEASFVNTVNAIGEIQHKELHEPDFTDEYEWIKLSKVMVGTGADGTYQSILIYSPHNQTIYCLEYLVKL